VCRSGRLPSAIAALTLALVPAPAHATDWTTFGFDNQRSGFNPAETALGPITARALSHRWSYDLGGVVNAQPLYASGVVFAGSERGRFAAIDALTGLPVWTRNVSTVDTICSDVPEGVHGVSATPVIDPERGTIWVAGGDTRIWAFDLRTGRTRRNWPVKIGKRNEHVWGALTLSGGRLLVATASHCDNAYYTARLVALDPQSGERLRRWLPVGHARGGGIWGWGGTVADRRGDLYVAPGNAQYPRPENFRHAEHVVRLSPRLRVRQSHHPRLPKIDDNDFGGSPILFRAPGCPAQLAVMHKNGQLLLYDRDRIRRGPRQRLQVGSQEAFVSLGTHAYWPAERMLFVANGSTGDYSQGLVAFRLSSRCRLDLEWQQAIGKDPTWPTSPVVANGIVVFGDGSGARLRMFDALDGTLLWDSGGVTGQLIGAPTIADGGLFAPSWDGKVHGWAPG
jgi:outer membrane protein assembly factor BamB